MKKVLLAGTALLGLAAISTPAQAEINLDLGGFYRFYGVYADTDEPAGTSLRQFEFRRDTEIHFNGEATTDAGLTVGVHHELALAGAVSTDETYLYFSGAYGRLNAGQEDGAAYLLQVAAPSADSNIDGLRTNISSLTTAVDLNADGDILDANELLALSTGYDHADFESSADRLTYLSPKWNGFQAGLSYAAAEGNVGQDEAAVSPDDNAGDFEDLWEVAARWDGEFEGFGISAGAGYSSASDENELAGADDLETYNAGLNVAFQGFGLGGAYKSTNNAVANNGDTDTWVVGASYDNGPYHVGGSWLNAETETGAASSVEFDQYTVGAGYTYGPGMTFRGAVAFVNTDTGVSTLDQDITQVTLGTEVRF